MNPDAQLLSMRNIFMQALATLTNEELYEMARYTGTDHPADAFS